MGGVLQGTKLKMILKFFRSLTMYQEKAIIDFEQCNDLILKGDEGLELRKLSMSDDGLEGVWKESKRLPTQPA